MSVLPARGRRDAGEAPPGGAQPPVPILVVDDDAAKRLALRAILAPLDYDIVEADSGRAALRHVMARDFAVILLDVRMPVMDGFETAALIRQRRQSEMTPLIFVTAYASDEIKSTDRYAEGAVDFICAPVVPDALRAKVSVFANLFRKAQMLAARASEVQASADQLRLLTDAAPIGIFQTDAENRYVYTNPRWSEITGVGPEEALGQGCEAIMSGEPSAVAHTPDADRRRSELSHRFVLPPGGGGSRIVLVTSKPIPSSDGGFAGRVGTLADVTAEAGAEAALSEARDDATAASRLKSDFLANMSHEIRTPMNGVIGMTDLLLETDLDARQRDYAQTVRNSGEALMTIINDILDFSKVEAGMLELEHVEFSLRTIVDDVVDLLARPAQAKGLDLITTIADSVPAAVIGDPGRVRQVLTNLVGNAVKFTQTGEVVVRITPPDQVGQDSLIRFEVSDTGDGIAADKLASIFQPFVQADTSTSRKYGGTGLGLAICGQLVSLMGGDCGVSSRLEVGSDFWFTVRVHGEPGAVAPDWPAPDAGLAGLAALVVDESTSQRAVLRDYLTGWGMTVATAGSAEAAAAAVRSATIDGRPFDVVLTDHALVGTGGPADAAAGTPSDARPPARLPPIVVMTAIGQPAGLDATAAGGIRASLSKPIHREELRECLRIGVDLPGAGAGTAVVNSVHVSSDGAVAGRLLLAEDNLINQKVALAMLSGAGYRVDTVLDGAAAVEAVATQRYDVILMDCQMPEMNGYEATTAIRAREGSDRITPIIAMTAGARREDRDRCLAAGMDAYLAKPVSKDALVALVARWLKIGRDRRVCGVTRSVADEHPPRVRVPAPIDGDEIVADHGPGPPRVAPPAPAEANGSDEPELLAHAVIADLDELDSALLPGLLGVFFGEAGGLLSQLDLAVGRGEALAVSQTAHKLKGSSASIGAARVAHLAAALDATARTSDLSGADELLDRLRHALAETEQAFASGAGASSRRATARR